MKFKGTKILLATLAVGGLILGAQSVLAGTMQGVCNTCHTMHNSQDGVQFGPQQTANDKLLLNSCLGCHTGAPGSFFSNNDAPIVIHTSEPNTNPNDNDGNNALAGGSFYWVDAGNNDAKGHNVDGLTTNTGTDGQLGNTPPGNGGTALTSQLVCGEGEVYGCHNADGVHHYNEGGSTLNTTTSIWVNGGSDAASYRFLNSTGGTNVKGAENGDWEYTVSATDHNVYWADAAYNTGSQDTINGLCAKCHGKFHGSAGNEPTDGTSGTGSSPWIRHPTDIGLTDFGGTEYANYITYDWIAPVGVDTNTGVGGAGLTTASGANNAFQTIAATADTVLCVSCHRAHGSPYNDMLRWSYGLMNSGSGAPVGPSDSGRLGCFQCHSTKGGY